MSGKILEGPKLRFSFGKTTLGQFFFDSAQKHGDRICQIDAVTGETETFSSVKTRSTRVAIEMQKRGITSDDKILFCSNNTLDNTIPVLGATYLGAKVGSLDPQLSLRDTKHLISLVSPRMIFVEEPSLELIEQSLKDIDLRVDVVVFGNSSKHLNFRDFVKTTEEEEAFKPVYVDPGDTAVIFFSSGTTGLPKAICVRHSAIIYNAVWKFGMKTDAILHFTSLYWISAVSCLSASFHGGGYRVLCPKFDARFTYEIIERYKVTCAMIASGLTYKLTSVENYKDYDTSSFQGIIIAGSVLGTEQLQRFRTFLPHTTACMGYAMTEAGLITIFDFEKDKELILRKSNSCGKPYEGVAIKVVDPETNELLGPNQRGEIRCKTFTLMNGYLNADSSGSFDEDGFLKTSDVGYYDEDDCFYIVDRIRDMFKYQSWHIIPSLIENVLLEHPAVTDAVVFGIPHEGDDEVPAACVVVNRPVTGEEIGEFVAQRVIDRERLRAGITIVDSIFKTATGKVLRKKMRDHIVQLSK